MAQSKLNDHCTDKLRLGIVGLGKMGMLHWKTWQAIPLVDITAVVDTDLTREALVRAQGVPFFSKAEEIVSYVDAVVIATPADQHLVTTKCLLAAGIHCLVEKPIAMNLAESEHLVAIAASHGATLAVGHSERFNPRIRHACAALESEIRHVELFRMAPMGATRDLSADVVQDLMIHDLDWIMRALNQIPCSVEVLESRLVGHTLAHVRCQLAFPDRQTVCITASRIGTERRREVVLHAADGTIETISLYNHANIPGQDPLSLQAFAFLDAIQGRASLVSTGRDALPVMAIADQVRIQCQIPTAASTALKCA